MERVKNHLKKKKKKSSFIPKLQPLQWRHVRISQASLSSLQRFNSDESKPGVFLATQIEEFVYLRNSICDVLLGNLRDLLNYKRVPHKDQITHNRSA